MLQQLTAASDASLWAIGSLLFFVAIFTAMAIRVLTRKEAYYAPPACATAQR